MASAKRLIVGLGNPGVEYEQTRHNVGFWVIDALADKARAELKPDRGPAEAGCGRVRGRPLCLVKPMAFMNRSGAPLRHHMVRLGISSKDVLVVVDDINLDTGVSDLRLQYRHDLPAQIVQADVINPLDLVPYPGKV